VKLILRTSIIFGVFCAQATITRKPCYRRENRAKPLQFAVYTYRSLQRHRAIFTAISRLSNKIIGKISAS